MKFCHSLNLFFIQKRRINHNSFHITTPIFYVNSVPHIGHIYSALLADALFRWNLMRCGNSPNQPSPPNFHFSTGTDEHGKKIQDAANAKGLPPRDHCDVVSSMFMNVFKKFGIKYTRFTRTTSPEHIEAVNHFWNLLGKRGHIFKRSYEGWYSSVDECFYDDYEVIDHTTTNGEQTKTKSLVTKISEENYAFDLSRFYEQIRNWANQPGVIYQSHLISYIDDFMSKDSAAQISISRPISRCSWGIPVPNDNSQTIYVWFDALVNYLTAVGYPKQIASWPPTIQILGIDIFKFHAIYWPAFLLAADLPLPKKLLVHGHWLSGRRKMSKSLGNVFCPLKTAEITSVDGLRYFLLKQIPYEHGDFTLEKAVTLINAYLVNDLGNLLQRSLNPRLNPSKHYPIRTDTNELLAHFDDEMSKATAKQLIEKLETLPEIATEHYDNQNIHRVLDLLVELVQLANLLFQQYEPWKIVNAQKKVDSNLFITYETVRLTAIYLQPVTPDFADRLLSILGIPHTDRGLEFACFMCSRKDSGTVSLERNEAVFPRIVLNK
ncbi:unnamed protein product [Meloidogyne enterolobii]|uniref:Uncharacterized protein n=1 Tax=Meloidogyne enterolobii TaxID=390850 RepID=A0ACB1AFR8_MELEN